MDSTFSISQLSDNSIEKTEFLDLTVSIFVFFEAITLAVFVSLILTFSTSEFLY